LSFFFVEYEKNGKVISFKQFEKDAAEFLNTVVMNVYKIELLRDCMNNSVRKSHHKPELNPVKEAVKEIVKEPSNETPKETANETVKETPKCFSAAEYAMLLAQSEAAANAALAEDDGDGLKFAKFREADMVYPWNSEEFDGCMVKKDFFTDINMNL
jgi:hypothetical protein